jgi:hypothetical protein
MANDRYVRIGTRGSALALWQANATANLLAAAGYEPDIVTVKTTGDKRTDVSLATIGGKGLFVKELEEALEREEIDVAVHSLKDVPSIIPGHFLLAGFLERADPRDAWIHPGNYPIDELPAGSVIGTSSPRRRAQVLQLRGRDPRERGPHATRTRGGDQLVLWRRRDAARRRSGNRRDRVPARQRVGRASRRERQPRAERGRGALRTRRAAEVR